MDVQQFVMILCQRTAKRLQQGHKGFMHVHGAWRHRQGEIQVDMNKGEHEQRGKQRCMNRKSCQGRREYVHSRNSRGIKIHSGKMQKP